tara:strand:+ start:2052 stop:2228 length:177 start_codon:yes stop_codon:yes gene_type:complete
MNNFGGSGATTQSLLNFAHEGASYLLHAGTLRILVGCGFGEKREKGIGSGRKTPNPQR